MITKYKYQPTIPYSLHDMIVNEITYNEDEIQLRFDQGYVSLKEPHQNDFIEMILSIYHFGDIVYETEE